MLPGSPGVLLETCFQAVRGENQEGHKHWTRVSAEVMGRNERELLVDHRPCPGFQTYEHCDLWLVTSYLCAYSP